MCTLGEVREEDFFEKKTPPLVIRENGDYEMHFFFNPSRYLVDNLALRALATRLSLRTGICGCELGNVKLGEFSVIMNPVVSNEDDREFVKRLFVEYFESLESSMA